MKEHFLKSLEKFKGKSPAYYALCGVFFVAVVLIGICGASSVENWLSGNGGGWTNNQNQLVLRRQVLRDKTLGMDSHTIFVPDGWEMEGEAKWLSNSFAKAWPSPKVKISSPDGLVANIYQTVIFCDPRPSAQLTQQYGVQRPKQGMSYDGQPVAYRPESMSEWKTLFEKNLIPERHPGASNIRVTKVTEEPIFTQGLEKAFATLRAQTEANNRRAISYGVAMQQKIDLRGMVIEAEFTENGKQKECISLVGVYSLTTPMAQHDKIDWAPVPNLSFIAPKGQLESNLAKMVAITSTIRPLPNWNSKVQRIKTPRKTVQPRTPSTSSNNVGKTLSSILDISHNGFRSRQGMGDSGHSKLVNSVHEITPYSHNGTQYELPSGYSNVFTNDYDTIILTNDTILKPNVDLGGNHEWSQMNAGN